MYACMTVYNDAKFLRISLASILPFVEKIIVVDGAYAKFPHKYPHSTDDTKRLVHELCGEKLIWVGCSKPWKNQCVKRNAYLNRVPIGKLFIIIDADEVIVGNIGREFRKVRRGKWNLVRVPIINFYPNVGRLAKGEYLIREEVIEFWEDCSKIPKDSWGTDEVDWLGRIAKSGRFAIYRRMKDMHYDKSHSLIHIGNRRVRKIFYPAKKEDVPQLNGVMLVNLRFLRSWRRFQEGITYKVKRFKEGN